MHRVLASTPPRSSVQSSLIYLLFQSVKVLSALSQGHCKSQSTQYVSWLYASCSAVSQEHCRIHTSSTPLLRLCLDAYSAWDQYPCQTRYMSCDLEWAQLPCCRP